MISAWVRTAGLRFSEGRVLQTEAGAIARPELGVGSSSSPVHLERDGAGQGQPVRSPDGEQPPVHHVCHRGDEPVLRPRPEPHRDLDAPTGARRNPDQSVRGVLAQRVWVVGVPQDQGVAQLQGARRGVERREQHHAARKVAAFDPELPVGMDRPGSSRVVEDRGEERGAVEPGHAHPVDRPGGRDQRGTVPVREKGVVADRSRAHSGARAGRRIGCDPESTTR